MADKKPKKDKKSKKKKFSVSPFIGVAILLFLIVCGTILDYISKNKWGVNLISHSIRYRSGGVALVGCAFLIVALLGILVYKTIQYKQNKIKREELKQYLFGAVFGGGILAILMAVIIVIAIATS